MSLESIFYNFNDMIAYAKTAAIGVSVALAVMLVLLFVLIAKISDLQEEIKQLKNVIGAPDQAPVKRNSGDWPE